VFITWSSHCDNGPYHGWVNGYYATNLLQTPITFNVTASGSKAGIWMSNQGPPADPSGNLYLSTGNGSFDGSLNFGESFLKLSPTSPHMSVASWFTPYNWASLNSGDQDLGCGGMLLIPGTNLLLSGGKQGILYLVNRDNMGHNVPSSVGSDTNILQSWNLGSHPIHCGPIWWDGPTASYAYIWGASQDHLRQYQFNRGTGLFNTTPVSQSATIGGGGQPGGVLSLSANGTNTNTGIVWASLNTTSDANQATVAGTLHAYNAQSVTNEIWNSDMLGARDGIGNFAKFVAPTIANGKVYMATFSNKLNVYGLFPRPTMNVAMSGNNVLLSWPLNTNFVPYSLQSTTNPISGNWHLVTNSHSPSNGFFWISLPATGSATYYRLVR
jgi:hypothetical protein